MSAFDVPAARALCDAATSGPWCVWDGPEYVGGGRDLCIGSGGDKWIANMDERNCRTLDQSKAHGDEHDAPDVCPICSLGSDDITKEQRGTADFIAAARTLLPAALDEIERLRAALAAERKACDEARRLMATPGTRSCPLCSVTIPRDHDHRLATTQSARDWCAAHDTRRAGENK